MEPTAIAFSSVERNQVCVSELSGEIHLITLTMDGLNCTAAIVQSVNMGIDSIFSICFANSGLKFYISSSAQNGGLFLLDFHACHCEKLLANGSEMLNRIHGICHRSDGTVVITDRDANQVKELNTLTNQVTIVAGYGSSGSRDGTGLTACFAQATGVCCEKDTRSIYVIYTSAGRLRLITSIQALLSYLYNLWLFLSAFHLTTDERIYQELNYDETIVRVQHYYMISMQKLHVKCKLSKAQPPNSRAR